jgi:signal peptidase I
MKNTIHIISLIIAVAVIVGCDQQKPKQSKTYERVQQAAISMEPSIMKEEVVQVDTNAYLNAKPERWDVVVFIQPTIHERWISRVVGLPGEVIDVRPQGVFINGSRTPMPEKMGTVVYEAKHKGSKVSFPFTIPNGSYFLLGDNTQQSLDSRFWGALPGTEIVGRILDK